MQLDVVVAVAVVVVVVVVLQRYLLNQPSKKVIVKDTK